MKICFFGTYEKDYPRNGILIEGLRRSGATVFECHAPVWERVRDKSGVCRGLARFLMLSRLLIAYPLLVARYMRTPAHDIVVVGYVGQFDIPLAWLLTRIRGVPLVFNPLVSLHDTFCGDRGLVGPRSLTGRALWWLDRISCRAADLVLLDTLDQVAYFADSFGVPEAKFRVVPLGADDRLFAARPPRGRADGRPFEVLFVGKLIPLHGCETILRAAALLRGRPIRFTIIGSGQQHSLVRRLAVELGLDNVCLLDWADYRRLPEHYAGADLCLGIFGASPKACRVVPNKVFQALAVGRPVLTADTPAVRAAFRPGHEVWVCHPGDPEDLARQIATLAGDDALCRRLADLGNRAFQRDFCPRAIADRALPCLAELIPGYAPGDRMAWGSQPEFFGPRHRFREGYLLRAVRRHAPGSRLIDAACGSGSLAGRLASAGFQVVGVDLSRDFLRHIAGHRPDGRFHLVRGDITRLPCTGGAFDVVVAGEVLEHLKNDGAAVREFWRALRPGGICVVSVPADPGQWHWHDHWAGHFRRYQGGELRRLFESHGFELLDIHRWGFPFVRLFHRYIYLPHLQRVRAGSTTAPSAGGRLGRIAGGFLYVLFQADRLLDRFPLGIGLIAIARKPAMSPSDAEASPHENADAEVPPAPRLPNRCVVLAVDGPLPSDIDSLS